MPAVALVLSDPVSDLALGEAGVGLLLASVGVGHLRRVYHPFRHAVARYWALTPPSVSVASSCQLLLAPRQLGVVLLQLLTHVGHGGVAYLHRVPVDLCLSSCPIGKHESRRFKNFWPMLVDIDCEKGGLNHVTFLVLVLRVRGGVAGGVSLKVSWW